MKFVLVVFDTMRRDHLSCYGYNRRTSPNIDAFAEDAVIFDNHYATNIPTLPYFTATLSGQRGITTGIISHDLREYYRDFLPLPQILARNGYITAAVSTLWNFRNWFAGGFQYYMNPMAGTWERTQAVDAEEINAMAIPWIRQNYKKDFFLFVHYWDPHEDSVWALDARARAEHLHLSPYRPPEEYKDLYTEGIEKDPRSWDYVMSQYDAEITYADKCFSDLLETLDETGITEETMVIVTSDHGEDLGEEHPTRPHKKETGRVYEGHGTCYEPIIHTPLIIRHPSFKAGIRVDALVQNIDILPTILEMCKMENPQFSTSMRMRTTQAMYSTDGRGLLHLLRGETKEGYEIIYSDGVGMRRAMVRRDGWKLIRNIIRLRGRPYIPIELFNLKRDPEEKYNLAEEEPEIVERLEIQLSRWLRRNLEDREDPLERRAREFANRRGE